MCVRTRSYLYRVQEARALRVRNIQDLREGMCVRTRTMYRVQEFILLRVPVCMYLHVYDVVTYITNATKFVCMYNMKRAIYEGSVCARE